LVCGLHDKSTSKLKSVSNSNDKISSLEPAENNVFGLWLRLANDTPCRTAANCGGLAVAFSDAGL
jgi:hypothetical protein